MGEKLIFTRCLPEMMEAKGNPKALEECQRKYSCSISAENTHAVIDWEARKSQIICFIESYSPDVIVLAELDHFDEIQLQLRELGYESQLEACKKDQGFKHAQSPVAFVTSSSLGYCKHWWCDKDCHAEGGSKGWQPLYWFIWCGRPQMHGMNPYRRVTCKHAIVPTLIYGLALEGCFVWCPLKRKLYRSIQSTSQLCWMVLATRTPRRVTTLLRRGQPEAGLNSEIMRDEIHLIDSIWWF